MPSRLKTILGPLFIIITAILWSMDGLLRVNLYTLPPLVIVFWEHLLGSVLLLPVFLANIKELRELQGKERIALFCTALFPSVLGVLFYTSALGMVNYLPFSVVVLLQQLQPVWVVLIAIIFLKEKADWRFWIYLVAALIGAYLISFKDLTINLQTGDKTALAALLAVLAGIFWAMGTVISKIFLKKLSFKMGVSSRFILATVFAFFLSFPMQLTGSLTQLQSNHWQSLLLITVFTGMGAMLLYYFGLQRTEAKISAICELAWPLSALLIDSVYFKNSFTPSQIVGIIILGIAIFQTVRLYSFDTVRIEKPE